MSITAQALTLLGPSAALQEVRRPLQEVARTDLTVLLLGETGAGKGVAARALHQGSRQRARPFVHLDCGSLPPSLLDSELFGYARGAFTGALCPKPGRLEPAPGRDSLPGRDRRAAPGGPDPAAAPAPGPPHRAGRQHPAPVPGRAGDCCRPPHWNFFLFGLAIFGQLTHGGSNGVLPLAKGVFREWRRRQRLHRAPCYIAPADKLHGRDTVIFQERKRKLTEAQRHRAQIALPEKEK